MKINTSAAYISSKIAGQLRKTLRLDSPEASQIINTVKKEVVYKKINDLNDWYKRIIGLDEVKLQQDRATALQERLLAAQEKRKTVYYHLNEIRKRSNELQDQIHKVKRSDDLQRYIELMKEESEILKLEQDVNRSHQECDREERESFTAYTNAVRDLQEKQRAQVEYTKYFGLVLGIVGSFLAFCYSTINKQDLKRVVHESIAKSSTHDSTSILSRLDSNSKLLGDIKSMLVNYTSKRETAANSANNKSDSGYWAKVSVVSAAAFSVVVSIMSYFR